MKTSHVAVSDPFVLLSLSRLLLSVLLALSGRSVTSGALAQGLPLPITETFTEEAKLIPPLNDSHTKFGDAVSLSGNRALVGAYLGGDTIGHAYIFVFDGATWTPQADFDPSDGTAGDLFGADVSLSGNRALIGAQGHGDSGTAYVFAFDGTAWTQQAELAPPIGGVAFGASVSLSGDLALVGDPNNNNTRGAVYVFSFNGITWKQQAKLVASDAAENDYFGSSVSLSDGRAVVGAPRHLSSKPGAVYVFIRKGATWTQEAELAASDGVAGDGFGFNVALFGDRILAGAQFATTHFEQAGAAYVFAFDGTTWNQQAKLIASDGAAFDFFGSAVSLSTNRALVGAPDNLGNGSGRGAAYIFERNREQP